MKFRGLLLCIVMTFTLSVSSQEEFLKGKLIDARTSEPIPFATVRLKGGAVGVISNADGSIQIPQKFKSYGDTLQVSSMGYKPREVLITTLSIDDPITIYLHPALFELEETIVRGEKKRKLSSRQIVRKAIANIPKNYPNRLSSTVGYYRDYQLKEGNYINLNEAIFEVHDQGFSRVDSLTTKVQIYDYGKNNAFERDTLADDPYDYKRLQKIVDHAFLRSYGGNEFTLLWVHDAIRNYNLNSYSFVNRFDSDLLKNHSFSKDESTYINDEAMYVVKFRTSHPRYSAYGTLYISKNDFAIHKLEYTLYDDRQKRRMGTNKHNNSGQIIFDVVTEYRRKYNKMYLNYISFHNSFILWEPPKFKIDDIRIDLKYEENVLLKDGSFKVQYNRMPLEAEAIKPENYNVRFEGNRLNIKRVVILENSASLFLDMAQEEKIEMLAQLDENKKNPDALKELLSIDVEPIHDIDGNVLNKWEKHDYDQFREYFVQQVKPDTHLPALGKFMNKRKPIFEDQPVVRPDNFDDYWMNTPLQSIKN